MKIFRTVSFLLFCVQATILFSQSLQLKIINIAAGKGQMCIAVFDSEEGFRSESPCFVIKTDKLKVANQELLIEIPFYPGRFGVSVLDDANYDGKMQYNLLGIPREGFGFSGYYHRSIKKPVFNSFAFYLEEKEIKSVLIRLKYF